jgi:hypothetical protein
MANIAIVGDENAVRVTIPLLPERAGHSTRDGRKWFARFDAKVVAGSATAISSVANALEAAER